MKVKISPSVVSGTVKAPPSKSMAHRLLICAGLAKGKSRIDSVSFSEDILATLDCLSEMGAVVKKEKESVTITGTTPEALDCHVFSCRESGSTLRFFLPLLMHSEAEQTFTGNGRLMQRPVEIYEKLAEEKGIYFLRENGKIIIKGRIKGGDFSVKGDVSSQFISGLIFSLPLCKEDSTVKILPPVESKSYIDMTVNAVKSFGIDVQMKDETTILIKGNQTYIPQNMTVEGDYSNAAFLSAFNFTGGNIDITGLSDSTLQGDRIYAEYFEKLNAGAPLLDVSNCPDLAPVLAVLAALKNGATLKGTKRLAAKESDRTAAIKQELSKFGAEITICENSIIIKKADLTPPTEPLCSHNDHRIAMALTVLCSVYGGTIEGAECVKKSYPDFFEELKKAGLKADLN